MSRKWHPVLLRKYRNCRRDKPGALRARRANPPSSVTQSGKGERDLREASGFARVGSIEMTSAFRRPRSDLADCSPSTQRNRVEQIGFAATVRTDKWR